MSKTKVSLLILIITIFVGCNQSETNDNSKIDGKQNAVEESSQSDSFDRTDSSDWSLDAADNQEDRKIIATVNGQPIYQDELNRHDLEYDITEEILYQDGFNQNIDKEIRDRVKNYERQLMIREYKQRILENAEPQKVISNEDIENYYNNNKKLYSFIRIYDISFSDPTIAEELKGKAENAAIVEEIQSTYPEGTIRITEIGYSPELASKFKVVEEGSVSEVIQKNDGSFSILKVKEIEELPLGKVKNSIRTNLEALKTRNIIDDYAREIAKDNNYKIEKFD